MFFLFSSVKSNCTFHIAPQLGFRIFHEILNDNDEICINISHFPFFIIFGEMPHNMQYIEYRSTNYTKNLTYYRSGIGERLPYYYSIQIPFASITILCPKRGTVSFAFGTFPGICKTGTFFINFRNFQIELTSKLQQEKSLSPFDDKCALFTSRGNQSFKIDYDLLGNLLIYKNAFDYDLLYGKNSILFSANSTFVPTLIRIMIGNTIYPQKVSFSINNASPPPLNEFSIFYDPVNHTISPCPEDEPCSFISKIDWELFGIIFVFIIASLAVFAALIYVISLLCCPNFIQSTPLMTNELRTESSLNLSPESIITNKPEPKGYFAMDPILRPPGD